MAWLLALLVAALGGAAAMKMLTNAANSSRAPMMATRGIQRQAPPAAEPEPAGPEEMQEAAPSNAEEPEEPAPTLLPLPQPAPKPGDPYAAQQPKTSPDKYAIAAARRRVNIKMYATTWCPACEKARSYMNQQGISFTEIDIEKNPAAKTEHRRLNPKGTIPTLDIDGQVLTGFRASSLENKINLAAQDHLAL